MEPTEMSNEVINSQELFCHLRDYDLRNPRDDDWLSVQRALAVWVDCWFGGVEPDFRVDKTDPDKMEVKVKGEVLIKMHFNPEYSKDFPIRIEVKDPDEPSGFYGDRYGASLISNRTLTT